MKRLSTLGAALSQFKVAAHISAAVGTAPAILTVQAVVRAAAPLRDRSGQVAGLCRDADTLYRAEGRWYGLGDVRAYALLDARAVARAGADDAGRSNAAQRAHPGRHIAFDVGERRARVWAVKAGVRRRLDRADWLDLAQ